MARQQINFECKKLKNLIWRFLQKQFKLKLPCGKESLTDLEMRSWIRLQFPLVEQLDISCEKSANKLHIYTHEQRKAQYNSHGNEISIPKSFELYHQKLMI